MILFLSLKRVNNFLRENSKWFSLRVASHLRIAFAATTTVSGIRQAKLDHAFAPWEPIAATVASVRLTRSCFCTVSLLLSTPELHQHHITRRSNQVMNRIAPHSIGHPHSKSTLHKFISLIRIVLILLGRKWSHTTNLTLKYCIIQTIRNNLRPSNWAKSKGRSRTLIN